MEKLFLFIFCMIGWISWIGAVYGALMSHLAKSWQLVPGYLTDDKFYSSVDDEGVVSFNAETKYHYKYKGIHHKGKRLAFGLYSSQLESLILRPYLEATAIKPVTTVYVNPRNAKVSTLVVGIKPFHVVSVSFFTIWNVLIYEFVLKTNLFN